MDDKSETGQLKDDLERLQLSQSRFLGFAMRLRDQAKGEFDPMTLLAYAALKRTVFLILAPHPQLDVHRDHQFTTVALAQALTRWRKQVALLLYTNHADQNRYPYGPAGTLTSLPPPVQQEVLFDRIYSHPVSPEVQRLKLFALESMHDLRVSPARLYQMVAGDDRAREPELQDLGGDVSYLRRGPRSNEIFFVYSQDSVKLMIDAFLAEWRRRTNR